MISKKIFDKKGKKLVEALKDVNLQITKGQIFGIWGKMEHVKLP